MLASGAQPLEPYPGSFVPWRCRCLACGKEITPLHHNVRHQGSRPCTHCAPRGFKAANPANVYVVTHPTWNVHKVGIAGVGARVQRLDTLRAAGWVIYKTLRFDRGADARAVETNVLRWFRGDLKAQPGLPPSSGEGYSETISADVVSLPAIWRRVTTAAAEVVSRA